MPFTLDQAFVTQFEQTVLELAEQRGSKLKGTCEEVHVVGESAVFNRTDSLEAFERLGRLEPTKLQNSKHSTRFCTSKFYDAPLQFDEYDLLKTLIDPTSDGVKKLAYALGRAYDDDMLTAMLGTAKTGKDGSGSAPFDTANQQVAHNSTGLTVSKLNSAIAILERNEIDIDMESVFMLLKANGKEDLLTDTTNKAISQDFVSSNPLETNKLPMLLGMNVISTQRIPDKTTGTTFRSMIYTDKAMKCSMLKNISGSIDKRPDINNAWQALVTTAHGFVRMDEERVVEVQYQ